MTMSRCINIEKKKAFDLMFKSKAFCFLASCADERSLLNSFIRPAMFRSFHEVRLRWLDRFQL